MYVILLSGLAIVLSFFGFSSDARFILRYVTAGSGATVFMPFVLKYMKWAGIRDVCQNLKVLLAQSAEQPGAVSNAALTLMAGQFWTLYKGLWRA